MPTPEIIKPRYGRRKLDEEAYAKQTEQKQRTSIEGVVYGRRKIDNPPAAPTDGDSTTPPNDDDGPKIEDFNLEELEALLADSPEVLDEAIKLECADGKPRKGAIELFLHAEHERDGGARENVVRLLEQFET